MLTSMISSLMAYSNSTLRVGHASLDLDGPSGHVSIGLCAMAAILSLITWVRKQEKTTVIPGPWGIPVLGNLLQLGRKPHQSLTDYRAQYGDVYQIMMGSRSTVVVNGIIAVRQALVKQAEDFAGRPDFYSFRFIGNGNSMGFSTYGPRWKMHRRIAQNALASLTNKKTNPIEDTISCEADVLVSRLLTSSPAPTDPHTEIYLSVGSIICAICFGKRYRRDDPDFLRLVDMNEEFMRFAGAGNPVDIMPWTRWLTQRSFNGFLRILGTMNKFCEEKMAEHLASYNPHVTRDVTDVLIRATHQTSEEEKQSVGLTDEHILTTVQELIGAGFDTIASSLQWAVLYMAAYPDIQEQVHTEIREKLGTERPPTIDDLPGLPMTEATLMEVLRHSCIFPFALPHSTTRDTELLGFPIPKDTLVFINMWSVSRDAQVFESPEDFNPRRFLNSTGRSVDKAKTDGFAPFGAGRRKCPGEQLARMEMFMFFSRLVQKCQMKPVDGETPVIDSKYGLTLKPVDFKVVFLPR